MNAQNFETNIADMPADFLMAIENALPAVDESFDRARANLRAELGEKPTSAEIEAHQYQLHGLAWFATYRESLAQLNAWYRQLETPSAADGLILRIGFGEYLAQLMGGIPMSQNEIFRLQEFGANVVEPLAQSKAIASIIAHGNTDTARHALVEEIVNFQGRSVVGNDGLGEDIQMIREQFYRFAEEQVKPYAHEWHLKDEFIPMEIIEALSEMGVFGLTIPETYEGFGMDKLAMCVVSEELSRGYIGVGSLGTRAEIAAELIMSGGTEDQKSHYLPKLASGEILPTAVFTEPNTGSDLGSLRTRGEKKGDDYSVTGNKTWITHAARADLMTLLVRTDPKTDDYRGLSMLLAEKPRGDDANPFPASGMSGGEIEVLGYRGMKEYEIGFEDFKVPAANLLGGVEGQGFKQLMQTFESARIQTAARAIGVAQSAYELGLKYANDRVQFGKSLVHFPRIYSKLAMMIVEIMIARQLSYYAAREKDAGRRCDLEAGMAKLLGARVAWAAADNALQIHGGNGFALEYEISRVLCDARILNIFEGAAEIQAQVIGRRLLQ